MVSTFFIFIIIIIFIITTALGSALLRYSVSVRTLSAHAPLSSGFDSVVIQRAVRINRLVYSHSVLLNTPATFSCRMSAGTEVSYLWDFGDGTRRLGRETERHVFNRTGEFVVEVTASNLVSSASVTGHVFIVPEPCEPPPVKNMGPNKIQVWRYQPVHVGVTYDAQIRCDTSRGLWYSWTLYGPDGRRVSIAHVKTDQQRLELPAFLLHYGTYRTVAKVQIVGSVVYSNFSVLIEVMPSAPVSVISGGTNLFIDRRNSHANIVLDGRRSYDPDFPDNIMSYRWKCGPVNAAETSCFTQHIAASSSVLTFPVGSLRPNCDLFRLTLTVHSADRSSSSEIFITVRSKPTSIVHVSCKECRGNSVGWDEPFSVVAECPNCTQNISFSWKLHLVNASSRSAPEVPFCSSLDISVPSKIEDGTPATPSAMIYTDRGRQERSAGQQGSSDLSDLSDLLFESDGSSGGGDELDSPPLLHPGPTEGEKIMPEYYDIHSHQDYEDFYSGIEEADTGDLVGRPTGPYSVDDGFLHVGEFEGDNLVGPGHAGHAGHVVYEKTLLDLHRELVPPAVFRSYTCTGTSSSDIMFKSRTLKPRRLYMLEVSASFDQDVQGRAQMFFSTRPAPEGVVCHVQPSSGLEIHTHFSIFCTSGKEDLLFKYSFRVGNSSDRLLYTGRDYQRYFNLPSGDPDHDYTVTVYIEVQNRFGSSTRPCPVNVTVWPSFTKTPSSQFSPDQELLEYGVGNLTNLILTQNSRDIINYLSLLTTALNRRSFHPGSNVTLQIHTRAALIQSACRINTTEQVMFDSSRLLIKHIQDLFSRRVLDVSDRGMMTALMSVLSYVLEAPTTSSRLGPQLTRDVLHITADSVLMYMQSSGSSHYSVNTTFMNLKAWQHYDPPVTTETVNTTTFYIPRKENGSCLITQLTSYRLNPYHWSPTSTQLNRDVADIRLFNCSSRKEIKMRHLSTPLIIEFQKHEEKKTEGLEFSLSRLEVNVHQFNVTAEMLKKAVQIRLDFRRPSGRAFPVLLLFRMHQRPTPSLYNKQKLFHWKEATAQIFLPRSFLKDSVVAYLMLLSADYDKTQNNKYIADAVNYTLNIESTHCLVWDGVREWKSDGCRALPSFTSTRMNCSCDQLSSFTVSHQTIRTSLTVSDVAQFTSVRSNPAVCVVMAAVLVLYAVLLVFCRHVDVQTERNVGLFVLPDNEPADQFLYAVTMDTGLRSRARMSARVYLVLYGEHGISQTRELSHPDHQLFTCNSRNTFILSSALSLGRIRQVNVWHDGAGSTPSWFLGSIRVKDLAEGSSWMFPAQCWLALDEGDGRVERKLLALERQLTFRELLFANVTECLKDLHPWFSVYARPSYSAHTHSQRLSVCLLVLLVYMCVNALLMYRQTDLYWCESGLIGVSLVSVRTGLFALTLLPVGTLVSFFFRIGQKTKNRNRSGDQYKLRLPPVSVQALSKRTDSGDDLSWRTSVSELNLSWSSVSPWMKKSEVLKTCDLECVSCSKLADSSTLHKSPHSSSRVEMIKEMILNDEDKLQSKSSERRWFHLQSSSIPVNASVKIPLSSRSRTLQMWCYYGTWAVWLCLCLACVIITVILGLKFSCTKTLLWIQSVFFSFVFCAFIAHPALILVFAFVVTLLHGERPYAFQNSDADQPVIEMIRNSRQSPAENHSSSCLYHHTQEINMDFEKVLEARQRARYLRLTRPPTSTQLKGLRNQIKKWTLLHKTMRELTFCAIALTTVGFVTYEHSSTAKFHLNHLLRTQFTRSESGQKLGDWWNWTANTLLDTIDLFSRYSNELNNNAKATSGSFYLIGEPVITKMEHADNLPYPFSKTLDVNFSSCSSERPSEDPEPCQLVTDFPVSQQCGKLDCYEGTGIGLHLGNSRSAASRTLLMLWRSGWINRSTRAVMIRFTLYSPVYNFYTAATVLGEKSPIGVLLTSVYIQSTTIHHFTHAFHYCLTAGELFLLIFTLFQLYFQIFVISQIGSLYLSDPWNWLEVVTALIGFSCFVCSVHHFTLRTEVLDQLQREEFKMFVDVNPVSSLEQLNNSLRGLLMFLLLMKCCSLLYLNELMATAGSVTAFILSHLLWLLVAGVILNLAFSCLGNLLFSSDSPASSSFPKSLYSVIMHGFGIKSLHGVDHQNQPVLLLCFYTALLCLVSAAFKATVTGVLVYKEKTTAKQKRKNLYLSVSEISNYIKDVALALVGKGRKERAVNYANTNNFVLEEFEDLVDELLVRLSVISSNEDLLGVEQDIFENQTSYNYCSEIAEVNKLVDMVPSDCQNMSGEPFDPYEKSRSPLEWQYRQSFGWSEGTIPDKAKMISPKNSTSPVQIIKNLKTSSGINHTIRVQIENTETLKSNKSQRFHLTGQDMKFDKTSASHASERMEHGQFCTSAEKYSEEEINIPGQCC
ncbi:polycystin-1-like protein 1 [Trichomycterus rosablanca]|uniref:polycystin-1-like protein 1 n=1 Tax=Trichomycterus rosablanca TaxID=2290929 RepID=UPI002F358ED8